MARARSGGGGIVVALVCSVFATIVFAFTSLWLYVQKGDVTEEMNSAKTELAKYVTNGEKSRDEIRAYVASSGSVVGQLLAEKDELGNSLLSANGKINQLESALKAAQKGSADAQKAAQRFSNEASDAVEELAQTKMAYNQAEQALGGIVESNAADARSYNKKIDQMSQNLTGQMQQTRSELQVKIAELNRKNEGLNAEVKRLQDELNAGKKYGDSIPDITTADGAIVGIAQQDTSLVYINRGSKDRILLGMTFEVFNAGELIKLNDYDELRGKATVEVIKVDDNSSTARIVRQNLGKAVTADDQIVNAVYNPHAGQKFYIYGDFDISGKGAATREDTKQVVNLVKRWGGNVTDKLTADIDFLVLGAEPEVPAPLTDNITDPALISQIVKAQKDYEMYQELKGNALSLQIPVLNQNRFLALIGYYER